MTPAISVIIPVYNVEKYLPFCMETMLRQTVDDIEILCVDDGSPDGSAAILEVYAALDPRIRVIRQENRGLSGARNAGLDAASGEWVFFLDSDDFAADNACEVISREAGRVQADIIVFGTEAFPEYPSPSKDLTRTLYTSDKYFPAFTPAALFETAGAMPFVWRQAYRRAFLEEHGLRFDESLRYGEDVVFQMEAFPFAKGISFISDRLYYYRWYREGSLMADASRDRDRLVESHLQMADIVLRYWYEHGLTARYGSELLTWLLQFTVPSLADPQLARADAHRSALLALIDRYHLGVFADSLKSAGRHHWRQLQG